MRLAVWQLTVELAAHADFCVGYFNLRGCRELALLGGTMAGRPLHLQVSRADTELIRIITLCEPDPAEWYNYVERS